ncbi:hypothetical protein CTI14_67870, partial [Methylobacterium radiotolerans]
IALILGETGRNPAFKKLVSAALASLQGPEAVAAIVDRRLTALEGAQGYIALILGETGRNPAFKKLVSAALASLQGPEAVAA